MKRKQAIAASFLIFTCILMMSGCSQVGEQRSPEEWLSLSYSGLAAMDQYAFTGSMSMKTEDGLEFKPEIFEGKVVDHQQLTLQTNSEEPLNWNPVQVLETLNHANEEVRMANDTYDPETVTLMITEHTGITKKRWEQRLHQQLDQLGAKMPAVGSPYRREWKEELTRSHKQLDDMLASMQAVTEYELVIDRDRMLPLKMEEKTSFSYKYDKKPISESRYTTVRFQSFNGASSDTIQQSMKRVTMD
ncbi:hypothetical protein [Paenibacillus sp. Soil522]|uniref:hypothetical protein n=1 Tax=Paenibacillus sp. Soil522 TaxID=1736388 RepID=UPI0006FC8F04|nr:hypothetical protein [Paenibacillus sp. Soil522]KRE40526.1 hypothetical protein ASG81_17200 [Paenibacillus sp. Soil522]